MAHLFLDVDKIIDLGSLILGELCWQSNWCSFVVELCSVKLTSTFGMVRE